MIEDIVNGKWRKERQGDIRWMTRGLIFDALLIIAGWTVFYFNVDAAGPAGFWIGSVVFGAGTCWVLFETHLYVGVLRARRMARDIQPPTKTWMDVD